MIEIYLPHDHWHAGKLHKKGELFEFTDAQYDWFIAATGGIREAGQKAAEVVEGSAEWFAKVVASQEAIQAADDDFDFGDEVPK
ncbi:hypothetical protein LXA47_31370 [Massilia sp. P8910]|uniref:DUF7210 family protein n=1 Tax=Massilia antarctica TaxID=2765360 RepID=UPI001E610CF9|nr:hypothetical protein [Massilia antarctica]MCE3608072.1 hypothetical protein [Massilia antarctica]